MKRGANFLQTARPQWCLWAPKALLPKCSTCLRTMKILKFLPWAFYGSVFNSFLSFISKWSSVLELPTLESYLGGRNYSFHLPPVPAIQEDTPSMLLTHWPINGHAGHWVGAWNVEMVTNAIIIRACWMDSLQVSSFLENAWVGRNKEEFSCCYVTFTLCPLFPAPLTFPLPKGIGSFSLKKDTPTVWMLRWTASGLFRATKGETTTFVSADSPCV